MKNILFATTALVATAGFAAAEVTGGGPGTINITGDAEIGIFGGTNIDTQFFTDVDVVFAMTGEADNGLTFGATVDLDEGGAVSNATNNNADDGGAVFFVAYGNARLDMGDTDGAFDAVIKETNLAAGSIADDETSHTGWAHPLVNLNNGMDGNAFTGGDGQIARFSYAFEGFTGHISAEQSLNGAFDTIWGVGIRYVADISNASIGVGLGYQTQNNIFDLWGISLDTTFDNGLSAAISYSKLDLTFANAEVEHMAIGFGYTMNALSIGVNYGEYNTDFNFDTSGFGLAVAYDLGGGLAVQAGYGNSDIQGLASTDTWSLGLQMDF